MLVTEHNVVRYRHSLPINWGLVFVPQQEAWVVERMGRFSSILDPGVNLLIPVLDRVSYVQSLKEIAIDIPKQSAVTSDNVRSILRHNISMMSSFSFLR